MARNFNGTTDRIDWASLYNPKGQALTVACWAFIAEVNRYQIILGMLDAAGGNGADIRINNANSCPYMLKNGTTIAYRLAANNSIAVGDWYHIAGAFDNSMVANNWVLYVNGAASFGGSAEGASETSHSGTWAAGGRDSDDLRNFNGRIAEAGIWNRKLTQAEVTMLASGYAPSFVRDGLQFYCSLMTVGYTDVVSGTVGTLDGTSEIASPAVIYAKTPLGVLPENVLLRM